MFVRVAGPCFLQRHAASRKEVAMGERPDGVGSVTGIEVGVTFGPTGFWDDVVRAARLAEERGLDAVGFWDHYHSEQPEWALTCGWSAYGYLAAITERIRLVPMVLCRPNYLLGVLAKESSILQIASGGRFELGIGAGDYPKEFAAWDVPYAPAEKRMALLEESVGALRELWQGRLVTFRGEHVRLTDAGCTPVAPVPPRVIVGAGNSRRLIDAAVAYADEINVYGDRETVEYTWARIAATGRSIPVSVFGHRPEGQLPVDLAGDIRQWRELGATRYLMTVGFDDDLVEAVGRIADAAAEANED
jgi:alkanesulfonate monooxygenase SsuD/methylene tetrahydromethanopterin reductase-like flavin-dependent oxidoreductase (luciferase family)